MCPNIGRLAIIFFFFNDTATTEIYTLSLHDALPISRRPTSTCSPPERCRRSRASWAAPTTSASSRRCGRSEEHTSELQSRQYLVCRLLLEKKKKHTTTIASPQQWTIFYFVKTVSTTS